jgi:hypothetical protein
LTAGANVSGAWKRAVVLTLSSTPDTPFRATTGAWGACRTGVKAGVKARVIPRIRTSVKSGIGTGVNARINTGISSRILIRFERHLTVTESTVREGTVKSTIIATVEAS